MVMCECVIMCSVMCVVALSEPQQNDVQGVWKKEVGHEIKECTSSCTSAAPRYAKKKQCKFY